MRLHTCLLTAACAAGFFGNAAATTPYPRSNMPPAADLGLTQDVAPGAEVTLTIALKLRNTDELQALLQSVYTPGNPSYQHFLTPQQFAAQFGPSSATVTQLTRHFQAAGFAVTRSATAQLRISGSVQAVQAEFGIHLHEYRVASTLATPGYRFRAPDGAARLSASIAGSVETVLGFDTRPRFHPNIASISRLAAAGVSAPASSGSAPATADPPGLWTVVDFGQYYNVDPLYASGLSGRGRTLGIVTLASFTPSDAFAYWSSLGLRVNGNRITQVLVDGGPGSPSDASGSDETTLDVEQSGGIAPGAHIVVYEAPNTNQGFIDAFATAVDQNVADTWSVSWGEWEWLDTIPVDDVVDPTTGRTASTLQALNDVLLQGALEGESAFCAAGDSGSYEANNPGSDFPLPFFSQTLSVGDPASQQFITSMGGTTLPGTQTFLLPDGSTLSVNVAAERAWSWDYLVPLCADLGLDPVSCGIFPAGGGGGVSSFVPLPFYQLFTPGIATTPRNQKLVELSPPPSPVPEGINLPVSLPGGFFGRNVPDISLNSDPDTGYTIFYTSDQNGFGVLTFFGGTSFAAPQFNGVASLFDESLHHRMGLMNFALYAIEDSGGSRGAGAPFRDITSGNNWGFNAKRGYDQATGVGVPNVANLLQRLKRPLF